MRANSPDRIASVNGGPAWNADAALWRKYLANQATGRREVLIACDEGMLVGYGTLVWTSDYEPFRSAEVSKINNVVLAAPARSSGIGSALLRALESLARAASPAADRPRRRSLSERPDTWNIPALGTSFRATKKLPQQMAPSFAAIDLYEAGGMDALNPKPRGRKSGQGRSPTPEQEANDRESRLPPAIEVA